MILGDILTHFVIVVAASLIGSTIFTLVFIKILKHSILSSASKAISSESKEKAAEWLQAVVKNGISDALNDPKIKKITLEILKLIREKLLKGEDKDKIKR